MMIIKVKNKLQIVILKSLYQIDVKGFKEI